MLLKVQIHLVKLPCEVVMYIHLRVIFYKYTKKTIGFQNIKTDNSLDELQFSLCKNI